MSEKLKPGWTRVAFGDVVRQVKDRVDPKSCGLTEYIRGEHFEPGSLRLIGRSRIGDGLHGSAFCMRFRKGDILYVSRNPHLRKTAVADFEGVCANTTYVCRADESKLLQALLPFIMQTESFVEFTVKHKRGSTNFYLNWTDIAPYEFALPPLEEQRRIAKVLGAVTSTVWALEECIFHGERLYESRLRFVFSECQYPELSSACETSNIGKRYEWIWHRVDELFDLRLGKMSSKKAREGREQTPYIKNNNVLWDGFDLTKLPTMSYSASERQKYSLQAGDLVVCEGGEIGRAAVWQDVGCEIVYQKALHRLRPRDNQVSVRFFFHYLRFCALSGVLEKIATGTTLMHLPQERLAALRLPFPITRVQQSLADSLDETLQVISKMRERLRRIRAFNGRVIKEVLAQ